MKYILDKNKQGRVVKEIYIYFTYNYEICAKAANGKKNEIYFLKSQKFNY